MLPEIRGSSEVVRARAAATSPACRSPATSATSRPRCSGRPASTPARPSARTARARSCSCTPGSSRSTSTHGLITTVAARSVARTRRRRTPSRGRVAVAGSLIQWLRDDLGIDRRRGRGRGARPFRAGLGRRRVRARVLRPVRAALAPRRPRRHRRPDPLRDEGPHRPGRARGHGLPGVRPRRGDDGGPRGAAGSARRAARRRRDDPQRAADAVPGGHPRSAGRGAAHRRDLGPRRGLRGGPGGRLLGRRSTSSARWTGSTRRWEPAMAADGRARPASPAGTRASSAPSTGSTDRHDPTRALLWVCNPPATQRSRA